MGLGYVTNRHTEARQVVLSHLFVTVQKAGSKSYVVCDRARNNTASLIPQCFLTKI